jgi:hypothetical protein
MQIDDVMAMVDEYVSASIEDHGYRSGAASAEYLEDTKRKLLAAIESLISAPAAPQQAEPVGYFQRDCDYFEQVEDVYQWDADVIPLYLHPPAEPQQAEPVSYAVFDPSGEVVYAALSETRCIEYRDNEYRYGHSAAKHWAVRPVFAHPPAAEVQRMREALGAILKRTLDASSYRSGQDVHDIARRALEGK